MGGVVPGQTTDAVAAALAEYVNADLLVYATSVDGVYDADPTANGDAQKYDRLTPSELVDVIAPMSRNAGASAPVDLLAAKLIERAGMRAVVLDGTDPTAVAAAVLDGEHTGTDIAPADAELATAAWVDQ
jgi:uridylate kinase